VKYHRDKGINLIFFRLVLFIAVVLSNPALGVTVISHQSVDVKSLTTSQLRRIYTMRQLQWLDDVGIKVYVLPKNHVVHKRFCKENLRMFPYQLDRIWNKLTFSGLGVAPTVVKNQAELLRIVSTTPGAIGYIDNVNKEGHVNVIEIK
jgi:ABC-type phosphate transport system substrate-binding protein